MGKMTLEELLNKLIEKGWKPRGKDQKFEIWIEILPYKKLRICLKKPDYYYYVYSYRELVSIDSGLWQFVCENGMVKNNNMYYIYGNTKTRREFIHQYDNVVFWILESSMISEDGLEQFLLDNIKIDE